MTTPPYLPDAGGASSHSPLIALHEDDFNIRNQYDLTVEMQNLSFLGVFTTLVCFIYAQSLDILSVLENEQDVSQFMTFLSQNNNLTQQINQGVYTGTILYFALIRVLAKNSSPSSYR